MTLKRKKKIFYTKKQNVCTKNYKYRVIHWMIKVAMPFRLFAPPNTVAKHRCEDQLSEHEYKQALFDLKNEKHFCNVLSRVEFDKKKIYWI